ncbi:zinc ribbon domain-containing protein [Desulfopila sp. IMCC35006]|uniref:FmdB family zinc ribbon protein n=1 Tax=Desulfopila sp. IMCC35006 TaxID=2569542 RepID=UPI0010ACE550|nr:zinc ribbon domain-containing protein [Desulfopila sp. IMCC35006]
MPIYEYRCNDCANIFEVLTTSRQSSKPVQCSKCQSNNVTKVLSAGSFRLGSGTSLASAPAPGCGAKSGFS